MAIPFRMQAPSVRSARLDRRGRWCRSGSTRDERDPVAPHGSGTKGNAVSALRRVFIASTASLVLAGTIAVTSAFAGVAKPARLIVPRGATALYWSYPMPLPSGTHDGTIRITNPNTIARVLDMVNALPVSTYRADQICPMDLMVPDVLRFSRSTAAAAFAVVVFQLGGCPTATVYRHGVAQRPTLGGWSLPNQYAAIEKVMSPRGQPLT